MTNKFILTLACILQIVIFHDSIKFILYMVRITKKPDYFKNNNAIVVLFVNWLSVFSCYLLSLYPSHVVFLYITDTLPANRSLRSPVGDQMEEVVEETLLQVKKSIYFDTFFFRKQ